MMRTRTLLILPTALVLVVLIRVPDARAEDADLQQTVTDLKGQTNDKERMDSLGASRVELSQIRTWLSDATNAIKEEAEKKSRQIFELIRAQLKLVDEQTSFSKLDDEARKLEQQVTEVKQKAEALRGRLDDKKARLRALKMKDK